MACPLLVGWMLTCCQLSVVVFDILREAGRHIEEMDFEFIVILPLHRGSLGCLVAEVLGPQSNGVGTKE